MMGQSNLSILKKGCLNIFLLFKGELKNPAKAIPTGTIVACCIVCFVYVLVMFMIAGTTPKPILNNNYTFLQAINFWPPIVFIGIFLSSFSAALSSLIGKGHIIY
jgi:potassium/chloride transporter 9